ncbi:MULTISPECIES: hypothetical protein [unclassified Phenylobacterium]|uniref:hypothetical protein n=1 Tax=unclassified Phenylobacterium TaxID=2640670 RepID=UPI00083B9A4D|nr:MULTISPECIES: hypothetical protein [unclassified Phenylobacterium]
MTPPKTRPSPTLRTAAVRGSLLVAGALAAAWLGAAAARSLALDADDFAPLGASRLYVSGERN